MNEITLKGKGGSPGKAEGRAIVSTLPISWFTSMDVYGNIIDKENDLFGKNIAGSILISPFFKGSTAASTRIYEMVCKGSAPKAIIVSQADSVTLSGAILGDIPLVHHVDRNPCDVIKTNDYVIMDAETGTVSVRKS